MIVRALRGYGSCGRPRRVVRHLRARGAASTRCGRDVRGMGPPACVDLDDRDPPPGWERMTCSACLRAVGVVEVRR